MSIRKVAFNTLLIALLGSTISLSGCNKNTNRIPYAPVDLYLQISLPQYSQLNVIGGWQYVSGGSGGLIIYRQTQETFMAYDRFCTFQAPNSCGTAEVDSSNLFAECDCDGTQYQLFDGQVIAGPANFGLQQYRTTFDENSSTLHVFN